jgi:formylmethanofuran dehydrogenase subunit E
MALVKIDPELIKKTADFHGHWCLGLAIGIRASKFAIEEIGKASDEEIVAVVEADMCAVDAIQYLTGCTLGKGNLIFKDYGKNAFTF